MKVLRRAQNPNQIEGDHCIARREGDRDAEQYCSERRWRLAGLSAFLRFEPGGDIISTTTDINKVYLATSALAAALKFTAKKFGQHFGVAPRSFYHL